MKNYTNYIYKKIGKMLSHSIDLKECLKIRLNKSKSLKQVDKKINDLYKNKNKTDYYEYHLQLNKLLKEREKVNK